MTLILLLHRRLAVTAKLRFAVAAIPTARTGIAQLQARTPINDLLDAEHVAFLLTIKAGRDIAS